MFDLKTFKELARIPAAEDADAILYDLASNPSKTTEPGAVQQWRD